MRSLKPFIQYWIMNCALAVMIFWAYYFGVIHSVLQYDITRITVLTAVVFLGANASVGYLTYILSPSNYDEIEHKLELGWFVSDICMTLGLLGTVIGFIFMMTSQVTGVNATDPVAMMGLIGHLMTSMGTALYTTAVGIGSGVVLKVLCFNLQHAIGMIKNEMW